MQLEIRNAVERDQLVYNGLGLLFGATIAVIFFRRVSLMLLAALPPVLAVLWSLGLLGWLGFKPQPVPQRHDAAGHGDGLCRQHADGVGHPHPPARGRHQGARPCASPCAWWGRPACWRTARRCCRSRALLFSQSGLIRTFGMAGALAVCISFVAVILVLPLLGLILMRNEASSPRTARPPTG